MDDGADFRVAPAHPPLLPPPCLPSSLDDAVARLLPPIADTHTRADLAATLGALRVELLAGRQSQARVQLALAYAAIERGEGTPSAPSSDVADLAAVRLSLVPVAEALGVRVP